MNKRKIAFWVNMILLGFVLLVTFALKYSPNENWLNNLFNVLSYLYMFSLGYAIALLGNKPSTLKGP